MTDDPLTLTQPVCCIPRAGDADDPLLPEGTLIRGLWRGEDYGQFGVSWRFLASLDRGELWEVFETMWDQAE